MFREVALPLAWPGVLAGTILSFARALGEFGATLMLAGNIPGQNRNDSDRDLFRGGSRRDDASLHLVPDRCRNFARSARRALLLDAPAIAGSGCGGLVAEMALEVQIEKKLTDFALEVSFRAEAEPLSILGASGAGKTMLLRCIAGLERPDRGRIELNDRVFFDSESHLNIPARQRRVGMLFQNYALFPHRTVAENIAFGLEGLPQDDRSKQGLRH